MTVKEMKEILNSYPDDNAEICFYLEDGQDEATEMDVTLIEEDLDFISFNFSLDMTDKERIPLVCSNLLYSLYCCKDDYKKAPNPQIIKIYKK